MAETIYGDVYGGDRVHGNKVVYHGIGDGSAGRSGRANRPERRTILLMSANPSRVEPLRLDEERRAIDRALAVAHDRLVVQTADAVRLDDLQTALMRHKPVIAHFSGHGTASTGLVVTDDAGRARLVPPRALSDLFGILRHGLRCVVLNACFTREQAQAIAEHGPCVVGMHSRVLDDTAIRFAAGFYEGIAHANSIRVSFELARNRLRLHGHPDESAPVLVAVGGDAERAVIES
jgi:hypothetical protein